MAQQLRSACVAVGLPSSVVDVLLGDGRYSEHQVVLHPHHLVGAVLHAIPPVSSHGLLPWEEWFVAEGEVRHLLLFVARRAGSTGEWFGSSGDVDHPEVVLGVRWFSEEAAVVTPYLLMDRSEAEVVS